MESKSVTKDKIRAWLTGLLALTLTPTWGLGLFYAVHGSQLRSWWLYFVSLGLTVLLYFVVARRTGHPVIRLFAAVLGIVLFPTALKTINCELDTSAHTPHSAVIVEKEVSDNSRKRAPTFYLTIRASEATQEPSELDDTLRIHVPRPFFHSVEEGERITLHLGSGRLGFAWWTSVQRLDSSPVSLRYWWDWMLGR